MAGSGLSRVVAIAQALPEELQKAELRGVRRSALVVTRGIRAEIRTASGGNNRLSGVGRRGARVGARYDVNTGPNPSALISAKGPLHLLEHPTRPHNIAPKRKKALRFANGVVRGSADHPGTQPSRPFERGYLATRGETGVIFDREIQNAIRKALR
jgi:hypothetical protein